MVVVVEKKGVSLRHSPRLNDAYIVVADMRYTVNQSNYWR